MDLNLDLYKNKIPYSPIVCQFFMSDDYVEVHPIFGHIYTHRKSKKIYREQWGFPGKNEEITIEKLDV